MNDSVVFNDASLPFPSDLEPQQRMYDFFRSLSILSSAQISIVKKDETPSKWAELDYAEGFSFGRWLNNHLDYDQKLFISNIMSKVDCPFSKGAQKFLDPRIFVLACDDTIDVDAMGYASHLDVAALSFASNAIWSRNECQIVEHFNDQKPNEKTVQNICTPDRAEEWAKYVSVARQKKSDFLKHLKQENNQDLPNLLFCNNVLKGWQRPGPWCSYQSEIVDALSLLNSSIAASTNLTELIDQTGLNISDESQTTSANPKFWRQRMFKHPKLGKHYFGLHVKNFRNAKRLYFLPNFCQKTICIGFFGNHLGTTSDPT